MLEQNAIGNANNVSHPVGGHVGDDHRVRMRMLSKRRQRS